MIYFGSGAGGCGEIIGCEWKRICRIRHSQNLVRIHQRRADPEKWQIASNPDGKNAKLARSAEHRETDSILEMRHVWAGRDPRKMGIPPIHQTLPAGHGNNRKL